MIQNNFNFIGRLTKKVDYKPATDPNKHNSIANLDMAIDKSKDEAEFVHLTAWGTTADFLNNYTDKGYLIAVTGRVDLSRKGELKTEKGLVTATIPGFYVDEVRLLSKPQIKE